jgi:LysM domain
MKIFPQATVAARVAALLLLLLCLSGCSSLGKVSGYFRQSDYCTHTVKWPGENLFLISKWYTGSGENWKILAQVNRNLDPDRIYVGEAIRIPENIVKTRKPLPQGFVQPRTVRQVGPVTSKAEDEPPRLFGPKPYRAR